MSLGTAPAKASGVGGPIAWLDGDVVTVDVRGKKPQLATLDPGSGQIRSEVEVEHAPADLAPGTSRRELYVAQGGKPDTWSVFDGLHLTPMRGTGGAEAVVLGDAETEFSLAPAHLPQRELRLGTWDGTKLVQDVRFGIPERSRKGHGFAILAASTATSAHLEVVAVSFVTAHGSRSDEEKLQAVLSRINVSMVEKLPKKLDDELGRITKKMKFGEWMIYFIGGLTETGAWPQSGTTRRDSIKSPSTRRGNIWPSAAIMAFACLNSLDVLPV